jgi:multisubunit Na+/H+ antiporter MnhF subunit
MSDILSLVLSIALAIHIALIAVCVWRVWRGENVIDRLIGADLVGTLMLAVLVLIALIWLNAAYIDVALGLAALGFVGTIALAKYIADQQMF